MAVTHENIQEVYAFLG